jgi:hypothetical protein
MLLMSCGEGEAAELVSVEGSNRLSAPQRDLRPLCGEIGQLLFLPQNDEVNQSNNVTVCDAEFFSCKSKWTVKER